MDGTAVVDPKKPGTIAEVEAMAGESFGKGRGTPGKSGLYLDALRECKGLPAVEYTNGNLLQCIEEAKGVYATLFFRWNGKRANLERIEYLPQNQVPPLQGPAPVQEAYAAPVAAQAYAPAAPVYAAPAPGYAPPPTVAPDGTYPGPVTTAAQPVPPAPPFIPSMPAPPSA